MSEVSQMEERESGRRADGWSEGETGEMERGG